VLTILVRQLLGFLSGAAEPAVSDTTSGELATDGQRALWVRTSPLSTVGSAADVVTPFTLAAVNATATTGSLSGASTVTAWIYGTFAGSYKIVATADPTGVANWTPIAAQVFFAAGSQDVDFMGSLTNNAGPLVLLVPAAGWAFVRVICSAYTSGTIGVTLRVSAQAHVQATAQDLSVQQVVAAVAALGGQLPGAPGQGLAAAGMPIAPPLLSVAQGTYLPLTGAVIKASTGIANTVNFSNAHTAAVFLQLWSGAPLTGAGFGQGLLACQGSLTATSSIQDNWGSNASFGVSTPGMLYLVPSASQYVYAALTLPVTTVAAGSNGQNVATATTLALASASGFPVAGQATIAGINATVAYTSISGGTTLEGVTLVSGSGTILTGQDVSPTGIAITYVMQYQ
jgi:hypothetical protein